MFAPGQGGLISGNIAILLDSPAIAAVPSYWLPASSAVYRIAFGAGGAPVIYGHEWGEPPDEWAVEALAARAAGVAWRPNRPPPFPAYGYRKAVRRLMREHEAIQPGGGNPAVLLNYAQEVTARYEAWIEALASAEDRLTAAVQTGTMRAVGVPVETPYSRPGLGTHVDVPPSLLAATGRVIRANGMVCWRGKQHHDFGPSGAGPYFAAVQVDAAGLHALWPPKPFPAVEHAPPWDLVLWRAFGSPGVLNLGSRPDSVNEPHEEFVETWDRHALRMGAWAAVEAAERELMGLLASGKAVAYGRRPGHDGAVQPLPEATGPHVHIPPEVFLGSHLRFDAIGGLGEFGTRAVLRAQTAQMRGQPAPVRHSYFEVRVDLVKVAEAWGMGGRATIEPILEQMPFPNAEWVAAWLAATWRAFGSLDAPGHIIERRSFDDGTVRLPGETEAGHRTRLDQHQKFDAAEQEIFDLLSNGRIVANGQKSARAVSDKRLRAPAPERVNIPASLFLNQNIAFDPDNCLSARVPSLERLFPSYGVRGSEVDPSFPHYYDVLIEAAGLRRAWGLSLRDKVMQPQPFAEGTPAIISSTSSRFWTATQVLTWIAFGTPQTAQELKEQGKAFFRRWRSDPPDNVLALLVARSAPNPSCLWHPVITDDIPLQPGVPPGFTSAFTSPKGPELARAIRADHRQWLGSLVRYGELAEMLRHEMAKRDQRRMMLEAANDALWGAILDQTVTGWGVPSDTPNELHKVLPRELALLPMQFRGDATEPGNVPTAEEWHEAHGKPSFRSVRFERAAVESAGLRPAVPLEAQPAPIMRTGMAGRPTVKNVLLTEMRRRAADSQLEFTLAKQAQELCAWFTRTYPGQPEPKLGTAENVLRSEYRAFRVPTK